MTIKVLFDQSVKKLKDQSFETASLDVERLFQYVFSYSYSDIIVKGSEEVDEQKLEHYNGLFSRRLTGEPIAYITGSRGFYKHEFLVEKGVLIPRPETELLVEYVLGWLEEKDRSSNLKFTEYGVGSGCIGLSLLSEISNSELKGFDISEKAIELTHKNAERLNLNNRIELFKMDPQKVLGSGVFKGFAGMDVVISNPPYIAEDDPEIDPMVKKFEPETALFAKEDGYYYINAWTQSAFEMLKPGGLWIFEIGCKQGEGALSIINGHGGYCKAKCHQDLSGKDRFVTAIKSRG